MMLKLVHYLRAVSHKCLKFNARQSIYYFMSKCNTKLASVVKRAQVAMQDRAYTILCQVQHKACISCEEGSGSMQSLLKI